MKNTIALLMFCLCFGSHAADVPISGLPSVTMPLAGTEVLPIVQTNTKKVTVTNLLSTTQPLDASLTAYAALVSAASKGLYFTGADVPALYDLSAFGRSQIDDADAAAGRSTLGLGSISTQAASSVAITGGTIIGITSLAAAYGGTGLSSYTVGDLLYASATTTLSKLAGVATGQVLRSGGVGVAPAYGAVTAGDITTALASPPAIGSTAPAAVSSSLLRSTGQSIFAANAATAAEVLFSESSFTPNFQLIGTAASTAGIGITRYVASSLGPALVMAHSRSGSIGARGALVDGDQVFKLSGDSDDGTSFIESGRFVMEVDGVVSTGVAPGRFRFFTRGTSGGPVEALRLNSSQQALNSDGTAALPARSYISDPNTGEYRIGADNIGWSTGGIDATAIDSAQNFWIRGTATHGGTARFYEDTDDGTSYVGLLAPALAGTITFTLPAAYPAANNSALVSSTAGVLTTMVVASPPLSGTTGSIGGSLLAAGACSTGTVTVTGATTSMAVFASPAGGVDPTAGGTLGAVWEARVSSADTVTVLVCSPIAGTPTAATYAVRVLP